MKNKKIVIAAIALALVAAVMLGIYWLTRNGKHMLGSKDITVTVVHQDGSSKEFAYHTDAEYLGTVLTETGLVEGEQGQYGLYIKVVDGERAVYELDQAYWQVFVGEEAAMTGADQILLHDGDSFKLVYTGA